MTVNSIYQSFSVASVSLSINARPASPGVDRVTLSPEATTASEAPEDTEPAPTAPQTPSRAERRAEALFGALDADQDGAITEQEFTEGAVALLRRAGDRRRVHEHDGEGEGHGDGDGDGEHASRGLRRLERKLEKAFGRVDANDDGAIDQDELTSALARGRGRVEPAPPAAPADAPPAQDPGPTAAAGTPVTFSFTFVSVAVQRYTTLQPPAPPVSPASAADDERRAA